MLTRYYRIGEAARAAGVSVKAIRYYERVGLIPKAPRHDRSAWTGGNRLYSEADVGRLRFIHHARLLDMRLADIRELLAAAEDNGCPSHQPVYREILAQRLQEIDERVRHLLGLRAAIEALMAPGQRSEGASCSWETCGCMRPSAGRTDERPRNGS